MATQVTVRLPKAAKVAAVVRHGARHYRLEPGDTAEVPEPIAAAFVAAGATVKKRSSEDSSDS